MNKHAICRQTPADFKDAIWIPTEYWVYSGCWQTDNLTIPPWYVLYNLQRIPCTEPFAINIVRSMIDTQLTFTVGLAGYCNKFIVEMDQLT
jgi:hypothetical protein